MIKIQQLSRRFGSLQAVAPLDLAVGPGQVQALIGPHGAGKSTLMRMLAGFLAPSGGQAWIGGHDVHKAPLEAKRMLGYLPEGAPSYPEMSVQEFLHFIARIRGLKALAGRRRFDQVVQELQLEDALKQPIHTLSKGLRRRVGLAQAILHDPPVLMLDEPTDGLDPNQKYMLRQLIDTLAQQRTILISTHLLEEVPGLCDQVGIMAGGRLLANAEPHELERHSRYCGAVSFSAAGSAISQAMLGRLPQVAGVEVDPLDGRVTVFPKPGEPIFAAVADLLRQQGLKISEIQLERGRLDEVFRRITRSAENLEVAP